MSQEYYKITVLSKISIKTLFHGFLMRRCLGLQNGEKPRYVCDRTMALTLYLILLFCAGGRGVQGDLIMVWKKY